MTKYVLASIASNRVDLDGECFTQQALERIAEDAPGKPITINFQGDPVGKVLSGYVAHGEAVVRAVLYGNTADNMPHPISLVPKISIQDGSGSKRQEGDITIFDVPLNVIECALTISPADKTLFFRLYDVDEN